MRIRLSFIALLLSISPAVAWGQGLVDGTVVNGNKFAGAPGKTVHLVNNTLKPPVDRTAVTDEDGYYRFGNVAPGDGYSVEVLSETGKPLGVDQALHFSVGNEKHTAVPNIDIAKGVTADEASKVTGLIVNDRTTAPGANVSNEQLQVLPLYNRTFLALGLIQPGVHDVEQGSPLQGAGFSIAGSRAGSTDFRLNSLSSPEATGVDNVASSNNQAIPFQVNEAVQDFRVIYATPDLRYGQGSGGVIDVVTSQGRLSATSAWHGSAFGYFNNDALNASTPLSVYSNSGFAKAQAYATSPVSNGNPIYTPNTAINFIGTSPYTGYSPQDYNDLQSLVATLDTSKSTSINQAGPFLPLSMLSSQDSHTFPVNQEQFGASAGGPLLSGKLLLFASYEGTYINNPTPIFERVPTTLDVAPGSISSLSDASIAQGVLGYLPKPNVGYGTSASANAGIFGFYRGTAPNYTHVHNIHIRPDIPLGSRGTLSMRYTGQLIDQLHDDTLPTSSVYAGNGAHRKGQNQSAAITHNLPFRKNVNLLNIGFTQFRVDEVAQDGGLRTFVISGIDTQTTGAKPGTPGYMGGWSDSFWQVCGGGIAIPGCTGSTPTNQSPSPITPSLDGDFPLARIGAPLSAPSAHRDTEAFAYETLSLRLGDRNQLALGGDYRYQQNYSYDGGLARGLVVSNNIGEFTSDSETCISCGTAFSKPSFDYELRQPSPYVGDLRSSSFGVFAEDNFQPTNRVTLSAGVRYDYFGEPLDTQGRLWNYSQADQGLVEQATSGTFDAFDYQCKGASTQTAIDSFYGAKRPSFSSGWNCTQNGSFFLPQNKHDLTGRLGLSFSPDNTNKTVMRAAVGGYYDHLPASYNEQLLKNRPSAFNVSNPSAIYGQNFDSTGCGPFPAQCGFGNHTLNVQAEATDSNFQNYQAASGANILYERDPNNLQTPYSIQFSAGIQRQITSAWTMEIGYVGSASHRLPLIYDGNFTNEFYCTQGGGTPAAPGGLCNNNTFFPVFTESHFGAANYNSAIVRVSSQQWHGLSLHAAYTYARSMDDIAGGQFPQSTDAIWSQLFARQLYGMGNPVSFALGAGSASGSSLPTSGRIPALLSATTGLADRAALATSANIPSFNAISSALTTTGSRPITVSHYNLPQNPLAFSSSTAGQGGDYGPSDFDVRSRAVADFVYRLPDFGSRWTNGFLLSGIFTAQTGQPFSIFSGPAYGQVNQRINATTASTIHTTGDPKNFISGVSTQNLVSVRDAALGANNPCPSLYAVGKLYTGSPVAPAPYACPGNTGRNSFTGPSYINQDFAIQKTTRVHGESQNIIVRAEFFNLFNRANYYNPISQYSLDGVHVNPEFGLVRSAHDPLQIQFAVRYAY
jgi:hypothetical protein